MVNNNELLLGEEQKKAKKKLYKNWKLYASALGIIVIGLGVGLGVGLNIHHSQTNNPNNLNNFNKTAISGIENMTQDDAWNLFLSNNKNKNLTNLQDNVEISFNAPKYISAGSLKITAKTNTKYSGEITVIINAIGQTPLNVIDNLHTEIPKIVRNSNEAWKAFINENSTVTDLENNIEAGTFTEPTYTSGSSLIINAKADSKYSGTITVSFLKLIQNPIDNGLLNKTIIGTEAIQNDDTGKEAFKAFLIANNSWTNLSDFVDYSSFTKPTFTTNGSLIITAKENTPYYGSLTVTITKLTQTKLSELNLNTTAAGVQDTTDEQFFQIFLDENKNIFGDSLTRDQVELTNFNGIKIGQNGTLTISVKEGINNKFTGSIDMTLKYRLDDETILDMMTFLSDNNQLNFQILTGTKQSELMQLLTEEFRTKLSDYYVYADDIESIDVTTPRYEPTQEELDTKDFVWIPPKHTDQANLGISYLWLGFTVTYKDGTIKTPSQGPLDDDGYHHSNSVLIAWNLNATITMV